MISAQVIAGHSRSLDRRRARVLHLVPGNLYGGVETFLVALARYSHFAPRLEQEFVLLHRGRLSEELTAEGQVVHFLPPARLSRPWTVWRSRRALARLLEERAAPVVVSHHIWPLIVYGPAIEAARRRIVLYVHGPSARRGWMEWLAGRRRPDRMIAVSRHTLGSFRDTFPVVPAEVVHYPAPWPEAPSQVSAGERRALRAELGTAADAVVILQASRMEAWKGQDVHIAALARLRDDPRWVCWMAGGAQRSAEARYLNALRRQTAEAGIGERVLFLGERRDVPRLMAAADVYCQGNRGPEGFSLAFLEALSAGLPVVTSDLGGAREMIEASCGLLVPPESPEALAAGLRSLIADSAYREELGRGARRRVRELSDSGRQTVAVQSAILAAVQ